MILKAVLNTHTCCACARCQHRTTKGSQGRGKTRWPPGRSSPVSHTWAAVCLLTRFSRRHSYCCCPLRSPKPAPASQPDTYCSFILHSVVFPHAILPDADGDRRRDRQTDRQTQSVLFLCQRQYHHQHPSLLCFDFLHNLSLQVMIKVYS